MINGDALDEEILKEANLEVSETVLALTNDDENNMMACVLAEKTGLKKRLEKFKALLKFRNIPYEADLFTWHNSDIL